jgi:hypothetical protein
MKLLVVFTKIELDRTGLTNPLLQKFEHNVINCKTFCDTDCDTNCDTDTKEVPIETETDTDCNTDIRFSHFFNKIRAEKLQVSLLFEPFNQFEGHFGVKITIWFVIYSKT